MPHLEIYKLREFLHDIGTTVTVCGDSFDPDPDKVTVMVYVDPDDHSHMKPDSDLWEVFADDYQYPPRAISSPGTPLLDSMAHTILDEEEGTYTAALVLNNDGSIGEYGSDIVGWTILKKKA